MHQTNGFLVNGRLDLGRHGVGACVLGWVRLTEKDRNEVGGHGVHNRHRRQIASQKTGRRSVCRVPQTQYRVRCNSLSTAFQFAQGAFNFNSKNTFLRVKIWYHCSQKQKCRVDQNLMGKKSQSINGEEEVKPKEIPKTKVDTTPPPSLDAETVDRAASTSVGVHRF